MLIIGIALHLILFSVAIGVHDIGDTYGVFLDRIFSFVANILLIGLLSHEGFSYSESLAISFLYLFCIGALIGWFYGKWKIAS